MNSTADLWDDIDAPKAIVLAQQEQAAAHTGDIARQQDRIVRLENGLLTSSWSCLGRHVDDSHSGACDRP